MGLCAVPMSAASAATFVVDRTDDDPLALECTDAPEDCSLRGATLAANALSEASTISVPAGTYVLSRPSSATYRIQGNPTLFTSTQVPLCLSGRVTIIGDGAATTVLDGNKLDRVLFVSADAIARIKGVTIRNGLQNGFSFGVVGGGGGINNHGELTVTETAVIDNAADAFGGGLYNAGTLTVLRSTISGNTQPLNAGEGGGIFNYVEAVLAVTDSTVSGNTAGANGGGISSFQGTVTISNSTLSANTAGGLGGAIANLGGNFLGRMALTNTTISGNRSGSSGGGIYNHFLTNLYLGSVTITNNTSGTEARGSGGGVSNAGTLIFRNTLIAANNDLAGDISAAPDCKADVALTSLGHNLIQDTMNCTVAGDLTGNITGQDPKLGVLTDNGGLTQTHALFAGSPAIDAGNPGGCTDEDGNLLARDQRDQPRALDGNGDGTLRCDIGAFELHGGLSLSGIAPTRAGNNSPLVVVIYGTGFLSGATSRLTREGEPDIVGNPTRVGEGGSIITTQFDLTGRKPGLWDVNVVNPDATSVTRAAVLTVEEGGAPEIWADVIGPFSIRGGIPTRFNVLVGNRGNVDALGVELAITVSGDVLWDLRFQITPPPPHAEQVPTDWSTVPITIARGDPRDIVTIPLILPVVPAGFTEVFGLTITTPSSAGPFYIGANLDSVPYFRPGLDPQMVADLTDGAVDYAQRFLGAAVPTELLPHLRDYLTTQLENLVEEGRGALLASAGAQPHVYSLPQLVIDLARVAVEHAGDGASPDMRELRAPNDARGGGAQAGPPTPEGECLQMKHELVFVKHEGIVCRPPHCIFKCRDTLLQPIASSDPNDKVGALGVGPEHFLSGEEPLRYAIYFENLASATAPAQTVTITDELDVTNLDLSTLSLGPIGFGETTVLLQPGSLGQLTKTVDLRPEQNLLVRIEALLEVDTGLLTWRFTSLDPATGAPLDPSDAAGFLPPNIVPPEGDGYVVFTVKPKPDIATGTEIRNRARIVFDANSPIDTPQWVNTIDSTAPTSQLDSFLSCSRELRWSGTDEGAEILDYTIFVSEEGGLFTPWLSNTPDTSAIFVGEPGKHYAFYSVARDQVGNREAAPATPDVSLVAESVEFRRADCNGDKAVDVSDAVFNLNFLFLGKTPPDCLEACNVNLDSRNDISDAVYLLAFLFIGGPPPEAPFPGCGADADASHSLGCDRRCCE